MISPVMKIGRTLVANMKRAGAAKHTTSAVECLVVTRWSRDRMPRWSRVVIVTSESTVVVVADESTEAVDSALLFMEYDVANCSFISNDYNSCNS